MHETRPQLSDSLIANITNALARWLPADDDTLAPQGWGPDEWLAAEWVAYWQNAIPWLRDRAARAGVSMPDASRASLDVIDQASRQRTLRMLAAAIELIGALRAEGIQAMPFKGALLAPLYYADPTLRPLADLDVLVRARDLRAAIAVLERLGYAYYSRSDEDFVYVRGARKPNVWDPDNVQPVELHFRIREEYAGLAYDLTGALWSSAQLAPFWQGAQAWLPSRPATLLHVCAHTTSDLLIQRGKLMQIADMQAVAARMSQADWRAFLAALSPAAARFAYPALAACQRYAPGSLPDGLLSHLGERAPSTLRAWCDATTLGDASESNPRPRSGLGLGVARLLARSRGEQARMWLRSLFPRRWNLVKRYPRLAASPLFPLCYLLINFDRGRQLLRLRLAGRAIQSRHSAPT